MSSRLFNSPVAANFSGVPAGAPLQHLAKSLAQFRFVENPADVIQLLRHACPQLRNETLRELCISYADVALYEKLAKDL